MPSDDVLTDAHLAWAAKIWPHLSAVRCESLLWSALRYDRTRPSPSHEFLASMALQPWTALGSALQLDLARELLTWSTLLSERQF